MYEYYYVQKGHLLIGKLQNLTHKHNEKALTRVYELNKIDGCFDFCRNKTKKNQWKQREFILREVTLFVEELQKEDIESLIIANIKCYDCKK